MLMLTAPSRAASWRTLVVAIVLVGRALLGEPGDRLQVDAVIVALPLRLASSSVSAMISMTRTNMRTSRPVLAVAAASRSLLEAKALGVLTPLPRQKA